jgi:Rod binding domain-containing protein
MDSSNISSLTYLQDKNINQVEFQKNLQKIKDLEENLKNTKNTDDAKRKQVAEDFASLLTSMMLKEMKKTLHEEEDPLYGGFKEDVFKDMLYDEYSKILTHNSLQPLVEMIYKASLDMDKNA